LSRLQLEKIFDAAGDVHANANQIVKCLIDLGLGVWERLSETQRRQVLRATAFRYCDMRILQKPRITRKFELAQKEVELSDRLGFALPGEMKRAIKRLSDRTKSPMSEIVREKLRA